MRFAALPVMILGVHCSVSGGLQNAFEEAKALGINAFQMFTRNQQQWKARPISVEEQQRFSTAWADSDVKAAFSHTSYLINLGSADLKLRNQSVSALSAEVQRSSALGLGFAVLHPGSAKGHDEETALGNIAASLRIVLSENESASAGIALENTAGQGSYVGYSFAHLRQLIDNVGSKRIGVCLDTCHAFAAGYDIRTEAGAEDMLAEFDRMVGLNLLWALHLNDSKTDLGSRVDRHDHIGQGKIGLAAFKVIMKRFPNIPKVIETPKLMDWDRKNLEVLRGLAA